MRPRRRRSTCSSGPPRRVSLRRVPRSPRWREMDRLLTPAEEVALAKRGERGDPAARREMIERNLGLVHSVAQRYRGRGVPYEDLVQEGTVWLLRAGENIDCGRGVRFSRYAMWPMRRATNSAVVDERTIRIPSNASQGLARIQRAEREL